MGKKKKKKDLTPISIIQPVVHTPVQHATQADTPPIPPHKEEKMEVVEPVQKEKKELKPPEFDKAYAKKMKQYETLSEAAGRISKLFTVMIGIFAFALSVAGFMLPGAIFGALLIPSFLCTYYLFPEMKDSFEDARIEYLNGPMVDKYKKDCEKYEQLRKEMDLEDELEPAPKISTSRTNDIIQPQYNPNQPAQDAGQSQTM